MSLKQSVFDYLESHPKTSLEQLLEAFSDKNKSTVRKYFYDLSKSVSTPPPRKAKPASRSKKSSQGSTRQAVFDYMKANPNASIDELCDKITDTSRKTIRDYRNKWIKASGGEYAVNKEEAVAKAEPPQEPNIDLRQKVFKHLNAHPNANLADLRAVFTDYKQLVTDFRSWKQKNSDEPVEEVAEAKTETIPEVAVEPEEVETESTLPKDEDNQKIKNLTSIIDKQKDTIERQKSRIKQISGQLAKFDRPSIRGFKKLVEKLFKR